MIEAIATGRYGTKVALSPVVDRDDRDSNELIKLWIFPAAGGLPAELTIETSTLRALLNAVEASR